MNKKGLIGFKEIMEIINVIFATVAALLIIILMLFFVYTTFDITRTEIDIFANQLIYSPNSFSYYDVLSNRVYPGVIDLERFRLGEWENSIVYEGQSKIAAKIDLKDKQGNILVTKYYQENRYKDLHQFRYQPKEVDYLTKKYYVLIKDVYLLESIIKKAEGDAYANQGILQQARKLWAESAALEEKSKKSQDFAFEKGFLEMDILIKK